MKSRPFPITLAIGFFLVWTQLLPCPCEAEDKITARWVQLLAFPEKFDGKSIALSGWLEVSKDGNAALNMLREIKDDPRGEFSIALDRASFQAILDHNKVTAETLNDKLFVVYGNYSREVDGHLRNANGSIVKIESIVARDGKIYTSQ